MENHARETEARAEALCDSLTEKLQLAERQRDASERARRQVVDELNGKLWKYREPCNRLRRAS